MTLSAHPYADIFPMLEGEAYERFKADISSAGQKQVIILMPDQRILDGRNRYRACSELGIEPWTRTLAADEDPLSVVISFNLERRHLDETQRALAAAKLANIQPGQFAGNQHVPAANLQIPPVSQATAAKMLNVSPRSVASAREVITKAAPEILRAAEQGKIAVSAAAQAAALPKDQQREIAEKASIGEANAVRTVIKKRVREAKEAALATRQKALPNREYGVIYADPEWRFEAWSRETGLDRSADNHYPTSGTGAISARDVASIAAEECVLFLWSTAPMQPEALAVMAAWGFTYKSQFIWNKDRTGTGYWNRNKHEVLLVGTRGNIPAPAPGTQWPSVIDAPVGAHSAKPDVFAELIEGYFPNLPKIELNRRGPARPGWDAWGNEAEPREVAA